MDRPVTMLTAGETVPGAKVVRIGGAGHSPMVEIPKKTLEPIEGFID